MKIEVGKKYACGRLTATVVKVEEWSNSVYFESDCPWYTREEDGSVTLPLDYFAECYEEYKPSPFEVLYAPMDSNVTDGLGMYEICLN